MPLTHIGLNEQLRQDRKQQRHRVLAPSPSTTSPLDFQTLQQPRDNINFSLKTYFLEMEDLAVVFCRRKQLPLTLIYRNIHE